MNPERLEQLLKDVRGDTVSVAEAIERLRSLPFEDLGFASLDHHRSIRQGFPEVILCEGKTSGQIRAIAKAILSTTGRFSPPEQHVRRQPSSSGLTGERSTSRTRASSRSAIRNKNSGGTCSLLLPAHPMCPWRRKRE